MGRPFDIYDGFASVIWPGATPHNRKGQYFNKHRTGNGRFVSEVINSVVDYSLQDSQEIFESKFVASRMACIQFRNDQLRKLVRDSEQVDESVEIKRLERRARKSEEKFERTQRELENQTEANQRSENLLITTQADVARLKEELERASQNDGVAVERKVSRELRLKLLYVERERDELNKTLAKKESTISKMNKSLQNYRQRERTGANGYDSVLGDTTRNPGQLTVIVHGLNIMRDPVRLYIIDRLSAKYGHNNIADALESCINMENRPGAWRNLRTNPESVIDINDFHNVVEAHRDCFGSERRDLSQKLREIREVRNITIHPDFEPRVFRQRTESIINNIADVLESIGSLDKSQEVRGLLNVL